MRVKRANPNEHHGDGASNDHRASRTHIGEPVARKDNDVIIDNL